MTNSSITAEAVGSPAPVSASFRWGGPEKPLSILLSLDVVDRLEREVIESFKAVTKRGSEVGGILLGRIVAGGKRTVFVEDYALVECEYSRGPLYLLSDTDKQQLKDTLARLKDSAALSIVGFFRSNTRKDLVLDEDDLALAQEHFADPDHVFLLVKPLSMKPSVAGFFLWENGQIQSESSYGQFPFKRAELMKTAADAIVPAGGAMPEAGTPAPTPAREERPAPQPITVKREEPRPAPPPPPVREETAPPAPLRPVPVTFKREERPAPPPIVPKREEPAPPLGFKRDDRMTAPPPPRREPGPAAPPVVPKREERPPAPPVSFKREERPVPPPVAKRQEPPAPPKREGPPVPPVTVKREEKPSIAPAPPKREERPFIQAAVPKREEPAQAPPLPPRKQEQPAAAAAPPRIERTPALETAAVPSFLDTTAAQPSLFRRIIASRLALLVVLIVFLVVGFYVMYRGFGNRQPVEVRTAESSLGLRVERNAGQLALFWNRNTSLIASAQRATLSITDGDHKEDVDLDLNQLRSGSIVYAPLTNDVSFRLEVTDLKHGKSLSESMRVLAGRPSPSVPMTAPVMAARPAGPERPPVKAAPASVPNTSGPVAANVPALAASQPAPATGAAPKTAPPPVTAAPPAPGSLAARLSPQLPEPPPFETQNAPLSARQAIPAPAAMPEMAKAPPQPAAAAPASSGPLRVGGNVQEAKVLRRVAPVYPPLARQARISGVVKLEALIGKDGRVKKVSVLSGPPPLRQAAVESVQRWVYQPTLLDGQPIEVLTNIDLNFTLNR